MGTKKKLTTDVFTYAISELTKKINNTFFKKTDIVPNSGATTNSPDLKSIKIANNIYAVKGQIVQVEQLPAASSAEYKKIYQYIGETNSTYKNGLFYKCLLKDNAYYWDAITVVPTDQNSEVATKKELENHAKSNLHITSGERTYWSNKANLSDIPNEVSDLIDDVGLNKIHSHTNAEVLSRLGVNASNQLTFRGAVVSSSGVAVSTKANNMIGYEEDGLYSYVDLSPYEKSDNLTTVKTNSHKHNNASVLDNLTNDVINNNHKHSNNTTLDKISDINGELAYNGSLLSNSGITISPDSDNGIQNLSNGLYSDFSIINKLSEKDGKLQYNGQDIGGGVSSGDGGNAPAADSYITSTTSDFSVTNGQLALKTQFASKEKEHSHTNQTVIDKLNVNAKGNLTLDGQIVAAEGSPISTAAGNIIQKDGEGLYATVDLTPYEKSKDLATVKFNSHNHTNKTILDKITQKIVDDSHSHENKTDILDKLGKNEEGKLTFNDELVDSSTVPIDPDIKNIISNTENGLYAEHQSLEDYAKTADISKDYALKTSLNSYMKLSDYTDNNSKEILGSKIKTKTVKHSNLDDAGYLSHDEIELMLENHLSNTAIHNTSTLNYIMLKNASDWNRGILKNFILREDETLGLKHYTDNPVTYTLETAVFTSGVIDIGQDLPWSNITWQGAYNPYLAEVKIFYRAGSTPVYKTDTWTEEWIDITSTKSFGDAHSRYLQIKIEATSSDRNRDIVFNYIQIFYGESPETELAKARVSKDNISYLTLKNHLDAIETNVDKIADKVDIDQGIANADKTFIIDKLGKVTLTDMVVVDSTMSATSTNPVQNKVIYEQIGDIASVLDAINGVVV